MNKVVALVLVVLLGVPAGYAQTPSVTAGAEGPRRVLQGLAEGSVIVVHLANGRLVEGAFAGASDDELRVRDFEAKAGTGMRRIRWNEVSSIQRKPGSARCPTQDSADAASARQTVVSCGVGTRISVTTSDGKKQRAAIKSIDDSAFTVTDGKAGAPVTIAYDNVRQIGPAGMSRGAKAGLIAGVAGGAVALIVWNWLSSLTN